jgi:hypothetical protein
VKLRIACPQTEHNYKYRPDKTTWRAYVTALEVSIEHAQDVSFTCPHCIQKVPISITPITGKGIGKGDGLVVGVAGAAVIASLLFCESLTRQAITIVIALGSALMLAGLGLWIWWWLHRKDPPKTIGWKATLYSDPDAEDIPFLFIDGSTYQKLPDGGGLMLGDQPHKPHYLVNDKGERIQFVRSEGS